MCYCWAGTKVNQNYAAFLFCHFWLNYYHYWLHSISCMLQHSFFFFFANYLCFYQLAQNTFRAHYIKCNAMVSKGHWYNIVDSGFELRTAYQQLIPLTLSIYVYLIFLFCFALFSGKYIRSQKYII